MNYVFAFYFMAVAVLGIRYTYLLFKLATYINKNLPDKAKEIGDALPHSFKFQKLVYKKDDVSDPGYINLRRKSKNAEILLFFVFISVPLLSLLFLTIKNLLGY